MVELERDPGVLRWTKKHGLKIPYKIFGFPHKYLPDFLVEYNVTIPLWHGFSFYVNQTTSRL